MDIKLRARLSAYSRVDQITSAPSNPDNVNCERVTEQEIDTLFHQGNNVTSTPSTDLLTGVVSHSEIDSLFN